MLSDKVFVVAGGGQGPGEAAAIDPGSHGGMVVANDLGAE
jgi:NAD(P)-dependent dehydrogenase (short-subunit alcohol dehydrogenase family)